MKKSICKGKKETPTIIYIERERIKLSKNIISKASTFFKKQTLTPPLWTVFPLRTY